MRYIFLLLTLILFLGSYLLYSERFPYLNGLFYQKIEQHSKAFKMFEKACKENNANSCAELGSMYESGISIDQDLYSAKENYKKSCKLNNGKGCYHLAQMYFNSNDLKENFESVELYKKSCNLHYGIACNALGIMEVDTFKKKELFEKARRHGSKLASANLGQMYEQGKGTSQDLQKAFDLYKEGCDYGDGKGCLKLGDIYLNGNSLTIKDKSEAIGYYHRACELRKQEGCDKETKLKNDGIK